MELSLQKKVNLKSIWDRRRQCIKAEKLHIGDSISYERFQILYQKYGSDISEIEFAKYFLDIEWRPFYNLQFGYKMNSIILQREYYKDEEFDEIEEQVKKNWNFETKPSIHYDELVSLWEKYGDRFPLKMFAEEIFRISDRRVDDLNRDKNSITFIRKEELTASRTQIRKLREKIVKERNFHMNGKISLEEFHNLYDYYKIDGLEEETFALKIFGIQRDGFKRFAKGKRPEVTIFPTYPIHPDEISILREKVICAEKLKIGTIALQRFWELYEKYAGILNPEVFAEEILDTTWECIKNSKRRNHGISILGGIEISDEHIKKLRENMISDYGLKYNEPKTIQEVNKLYYAVEPKDIAYQLMGVKQTSVRVFGMPDYNYDQLKSGATYESHILTDRADVDLQSVRKQVISENRLHYDDPINYRVFHKLHQKYAPTVKEYIFAKEVLDIEQRRFRQYST